VSIRGFFAVIDLPGESRSQTSCGFRPGQHDKIPHPILLVSWFHFHDGAVLLYLVKIIIDLIAKDKGRTPSDQSLSAKPWSAASLARPWEQGSIVT
jgi:hypothetical protein